MSRPLALSILLFGLSVAPAFAETQAEKEAAAQADAQEAAKRAEDAKDAALKAPPPAIPGATSAFEPAPALKSASDMSPNDALFDAINRGDAAAARDAMNRGAQLEAKNVLGQTPIDAAIEANRNDITFYLLSLRGAVGNEGRRPVLQASAGVGSRPHHATRIAVAHLAPAADPGTPNPAVGFNGF